MPRLTHKRSEYRSAIGRIHLLAAMALLIFACNARAQPSCSLADLKGAFAMQERGVLVLAPPGFPLLGPNTGTSLLQFDGNGGFTGISVSNFDGVVFGPSGSSGTYTVTDDCVVSLLLASTLPMAFEGHLTRSKREVLLLQTGPFAVATGTLRQVPSAACRPSKDSWVIEASGKNAVTGQEFAQIGTLQFDVLGAVDGTIASSVGGAILQQDVSGSYAINEDCTLTITITDGASHTFHLFGVLYGQGQGDEFYFMYLDPGLVISGTAKKATKG